MELNLRHLAIGLVCLALLAGGVAVGIFYSNRANADRVTELQNEIARRDKTIEVQKGLYTKLSIKTDDLKSLLDASDERVKALNDELKKKNEELLVVNALVIKWKRAYEGAVNAHQGEVPPVNPGGVTRKKVEFDKDFGFISVRGYTLTDPPEGWVSINQERPLRVTVAIAQSPDKSWKTYATSSEENVGVDIQLAGVNPYILEPKWYEKMNVNADIGVGSGGGLIGVGVGYEFGNVTVGPMGWITLMPTDAKASWFVGASVGWHPFQVKR